MFFSGALSGATLNNSDPERERDPPSKPTPVTFPSHEFHPTCHWTELSPPPNIQDLYSKILKPSDLSDAHVNALNVEYAENCSATDLLPSGLDETADWPPLPQDPASGQKSYADSVKADSAAERKHKEFSERCAELEISNDLAYRIINRQETGVPRPPRLAYMRKFWEGLESMSQYWDCSLDQYCEAEMSDEGGRKSPKRQKIDDELPNLPLPLPSEDETRSLSHPVDEKSSLPRREGDPQEESDPGHKRSDYQASEYDGAQSPTALPPLTRSRYKGRRTASGRDMPDQFRVETVRAFVEGTVWPFQCSVLPPRALPLVHVNKLNLPIRQTAAVYRLPKDRMKIRSGHTEGPMIGVQVRPEVEFVGLQGEQMANKALLDLLRELGCLLQIAQERHREGTKEVKPGGGKWWTTKPRWGGGPGGEVGLDTQQSDIVGAAEEALNVAKEKNGSKTRGRRKAPALLWNDLRCGSGYWDSKTEYVAIGKESGSKYDEVFVVSSLNHHISILKMTLHDSYMDFLTTGQMPQPLPTESQWCRPMVRRSQWFDLFVLEDRREAFRLLWSVMVYLTRST